MSNPHGIYVVFILTIGKVNPVTGPVVAQRGLEVELYFSKTSALEGDEWPAARPGPHFTPGKDPVPIAQEAGWAPGPVWTGGKSRPYRDSIPGPSSPFSITTLTELPGPLILTITHLKYTQQR
jgi:hypothetical protein